MRELTSVPTAELLERASADAERDPTHEADDRWDVIGELHRRGEASVFRAAANWCVSQNPPSRGLAADVLGQLGFEDSYPFANDSEPLLATLLGDLDGNVVSSALIALAHLGIGEPRAVCALALHDSAGVREAVAFHLGTRDDALSRKTLVALSSEPDTHVRDWATFGLGSLSAFDSPVIRKALSACLSDPDHQVRGEAIRGLAVRGDERAIPAILDELRQDEVSDLAIEATADLPDQSFLESLEALLEAHPNDPEIKLALEGCRARSNPGAGEKAALRRPPPAS